MKCFKMGFFSKLLDQYQELWNMIIRPPRDNYKLEDLGQNVFSIFGKTYKREDLVLVNRRGHNLACSHFVPIEFERVAKQLPCVIYLHGNCSSRVESLSILHALLPQDITVFSFDFSGSGSSEGEYVSLGWFEREDLAVVIDYLRASKSVSCIGLWGRSMGAATALLHADRDPSIAGMVLDSPFSSLRKLAEELVDVYLSWKIPKIFVNTALSMLRSTILSKAKFNIDDLAPIDHVKNIFISALFVVAENDMFVLPRHGQDLYEKYSGDKKLIVVEGDHNSVRSSFFHDSAAIFFYNTLQCDKIQRDTPLSIENLFPLTTSIRYILNGSGVNNIDCCNSSLFSDSNSSKASLDCSYASSPLCLFPVGEKKEKQKSFFECSSERRRNNKNRRKSGFFESEGKPMDKMRSEDNSSNIYSNVCSFKQEEYSSNLNAEKNRNSKDEKKNSSSNSRMKNCLDCIKEGNVEFKTCNLRRNYATMNKEKALSERKSLTLKEACALSVEIMLSERVETEFQRRRRIFSSYKKKNVSAIKQLAVCGVSSNVQNNNSSEATQSSKANKNNKSTNILAKQNANIPAITQNEVSQNLQEFTRKSSFASSYSSNVDKCVRFLTRKRKKKESFNSLEKTLHCNNTMQFKNSTLHEYISNSVKTHPSFLLTSPSQTQHIRDESHHNSILCVNNPDKSFYFNTDMNKSIQKAIELSLEEQIKIDSVL